MSDIDAFILIGGKSSRFGRDKATFELDGVSLAERAVNKINIALRPGRVTFVAARDDQFSANLAFGKGVPFIYDLHQDRGPLGAIHAALAYATSEWIFVLACDLPFVSTELIRYLAGSISEEINAVVPIQPDGRIQPLCAFLRKHPCLEIVEGLITGQSPTPPVSTIFDSLRVRFVSWAEIRGLPAPENSFLNLNSPHDLPSDFQPAKG